MSLSNDILKKIYINRNKMLSKTFNSAHLKLKYDYTSELTLRKIESILENQNSSSKEFIDFEVNKPFYEYYFEVLDDFDSDKIFNLMSSFYSKVEILKDAEKTVADCSSRIGIDQDSQFVYSINGPEQESDTGMLYAAYAHELAHFPQFVRKRNYEFAEYSEVLSMYFEYLMYEKMYPGKGKKIFINNRIKQLYDNKSDFEKDLFYAKHDSILNLPRDNYSFTLADSLSYYEGLDYVLSLIDYSKENNKKKISDIVYRVLFDLSSMKDEAERLKIDPSKCSKILKII